MKHLRNNNFILLATFAADLELKRARFADYMIGVLYSLLRTLYTINKTTKTFKSFKLKRAGF